ncbi:MAG: SIMPL domain-containing protein, partial [Sebaldella sp.]|nr:SIMPL domain-containing protein [Sebaldella sp.]
SIQPYNEYFSNYNTLARPKEEVKKSSDKEITELVETSNLIINPKKQIVTKTVNIEFQIEKK